MRFGLLAVATAASVLACGAARAEVLVNISKSQQQIAVVVDGSEAYRWPVSTGRRGYATPSGVFHPVRLERHWYSRKYHNSPMPWSVFFYRGYAVHGTMEAYNLGRAASHGCVRLRPDHARVLFGLVQRVGYHNTRIVVLDGPLPHLRRVPTDVPMAKAAPVDEAQRHFAKALPTDVPRHAVMVERLNAHRHPIAAAAPPVRETARYASWRSGEETRLQRDREAWLRGIDRKYGIVR